MNVLMLSWEYPPNIIGGLGQHVDALCSAMKNENVDVTIVTNSNEGPEREQDGSLDVIRVREAAPAARSFTERVVQGNTALLHGVLDAVNAGQRFDVVHAHDWLTAYAARAVKHALRLPLICTIHATEWGRNKGLFNDEQRHISDIEWWLTFEAWRVICCSDAMENELKNIFQVPRDKIHVIPNGVHRPKEITVTDQRAREDASGERSVVFVGRLVYEKGVDVLLQSFQAVVHQFPDAVLYIAGRGPEEQALKDYSRHLGVSDNVRFLGYISDERRDALYRSARTVVVPSRYEPFGIVALEAMAHGAPVIAAATGGLAEVIDHGQTGMLFHPGHAQDLADQLVTLFRDDGLRERVSRNADQLIRDRYDWSTIAWKTRNVYAEVIKQSRLEHMPKEAVTIS